MKVIKVISVYPQGHQVLNGTVVDLQPRSQDDEADNGVVVELQLDLCADRVGT